MKTVLRENGLSLFFASLFLSTLVAQSVAGERNHNAELRAHGDPELSWSNYVASSDFWGAVMENWQSEFLQFTLIILATVWLVQRGSTESKKLEEAGLKDEGARGPRRKLYENSLGLAMLLVFFGSLFAQSLTNWTMFNDEQAAHGEAAVSWVGW